MTSADAIAATAQYVAFKMADECPSAPVRWAEMGEGVYFAGLVIPDEIRSKLVFQEGRQALAVTTGQTVTGKDGKVRLVIAMTQYGQQQSTGKGEVK